MFFSLTIDFQGLIIADYVRGDVNTKHLIKTSGLRPGVVMCYWLMPSRVLLSRQPTHLHPYVKPSKSP